MTVLPVHPRTQLTALAIGKRGPIWPIMGGAPDPADDGKPETFTQADVDRIIGERLTRQRSEIASKYGDLDTLLTSHQELTATKEAAATPDDKLQAQINDLQTKLAAEAEARVKAEATTAEANRTQYGVDKGLPLALAKKLIGADSAALDAEIAELTPHLAPATDASRRPAPNAHQGQPPSGKGSKPSSVSAGAELYAKSHPKPNA